MQVSRKSEKRYMLLFLFCVLYSFKLVMYIESWFVTTYRQFSIAAYVFAISFGDLTAMDKLTSRSISFFIAMNET